MFSFRSLGCRSPEVSAGLRHEGIRLWDIPSGREYVESRIASLAGVEREGVALGVERGLFTLVVGACEGAPTYCLLGGAYLLIEKRPVGSFRNYVLLSVSVHGVVGCPVYP